MKDFISKAKELKNKAVPWQCSFCGFNEPTIERSICSRAFGIYTCVVCSQDSRNKDFLRWLETPDTWKLSL